MASKKKTFNEEECIIPEIWCGEAASPPKKKGKVYIKAGTRYECMKKGFGAGTHIERNSNLPTTSLQQIKYVGEQHEKDFKAAGIKTIPQLVSQMKLKTTDESGKILKRILTKSNGVLDVKAYNSTVLYLYKHGVPSAPPCQKIKH
jgi:hypothetical protein